MEFLIDLIIKTMKLGTPLMAKVHYCKPLIDKNKRKFVMPGWKQTA
jgi:hypothetical protein